jgi:C4-type Zn-finger protein
MEEIIINEEGVCPICGKDDFIYDGQEVDGDILYYYMKCNNCNASITETYILEYNYTRATKN